jgi:hypothetical protein
MGKFPLLHAFLCASHLSLAETTLPSPDIQRVDWSLKTETVSLGPGWPVYMGSISTSPGFPNSRSKSSTKTAISFFAGLPYAQPPLGKLRFMAPQSLQPDFEGHEGDVDDPVVDVRGWGDGSNVTCVQQPAFAGLGTEGISTSHPSRQHI